MLSLVHIVSSSPVLSEVDIKHGYWKEKIYESVKNEDTASICLQLLSHPIDNHVHVSRDADLSNFDRAGFKFKKRKREIHTNTSTVPTIKVVPFSTIYFDY